MEQNKPSILSRFYGPIGFMTFIVLGYIALSIFFTVPLSLDESKVRENVTSLMDKVPKVKIPAGLTSVGEFDIQLRDGEIFLYAKVDAQILGEQVQATLFASGTPVYRGPGFFGSLYEAFTEDVLGKDVIYHFYDFDIDPATFMIGGKPAIDAAIPGGQRVVEHIAEDTLIGNTIVGGLKMLGRDTSDGARDQWTADKLRVFQVPLIKMFSQFVEDNINNKTLYTFGTNPAEQMFLPFFKEFEVSEGKFTVVLYFAQVFIFLMIPLFTALYGLGWWIARLLMTLRDQGVVSEMVSDDVAEKIGNVVDLTKS